MKKIILILIIVVVSVFAYYAWQSIDQENKDTQQSEEEFNNSGRAKAIEDETDLWKFYEDEDADFSIQYPHDVFFNEKIGKEISLAITSEEISSLEGTMGFNRETALKNIESLAIGEYGDNVSWPLEVSKKVTNIGDVNGQEFMVLGRFEVCDVTFQRVLYFFHNDHQITVSLIGPKEMIQESMSEYFKTDYDNCREEIIWDFDKQEQFYNDLADGQGSEVAQQWFDYFDRIIGTIKLYN